MVSVRPMKMVAMVLLFTGCATKIKTDESAVVKIVTVKEYLLLDDDFSKRNDQREQKSVKKYDINGNLLEERDFWNNTSSGGMIYKYNEKNQKTEQYQLDGRGEARAGSMFTYTKNQADQVNIGEDGSETKAAAFYIDSDGNIIREINYYYNGTIMSDFRYQYNGTHQETERSGTLDGQITPVNAKIYDSLANLIKQYQKDSLGVVKWTEDFTYDFNEDGKTGEVLLMENLTLLRHRP